jgi:hypothetical protein
MQKVIKLSAGENGSKPTSDKMIVLHSWFYWFVGGVCSPPNAPI